MKKILMLTVLLTYVFLVHYSIAGETITVKSNEKPGLTIADMEKLSGQWGDPLNPPNGNLIMVFRFEKKNGEFKAFFIVPALGDKWGPVSDVELVDGNLTLKISFAEAEYKGKITGDEIVGEWIQGGKQERLNLKKGEYIPVAVMKLSKAAMERLEGQWYGAFNIPGEAPFIQVFRFEIKEGEFNAFYDMPDDGVIGIPISDVKLADGTNTLEFSVGTEKYKGEITGDEIVGEESGIPLTLIKGEYKPAPLSLSKETRDKISGEWHGQIKTPEGPYDIAFIFETTEKGDLAGFYKDSGFPYIPPIQEVDFTNNKLTLNFGHSFNIKFRGTLAGEMLTGELAHPEFGNILIPMKKQDDLKN